MPDFETMPIGTRDAIRETAELLRSYERHHRDIAAKTGARTGRDEKAQRNADAAARLEALLEQPGIARTTPAVEGVGSITGGGPRGQEITPQWTDNGGTISGQDLGGDYGAGCDEFPLSPV